jgi:predicted RNA-binding Zn-ribbon protein involved in translation (DUF1610 family)
MAESKGVRCPDCGVEMNRHAEKVDYTAGLAEPRAVDPDLGGILLAVHQCPDCGNVETRRAT